MDIDLCQDCHERCVLGNGSCQIIAASYSINFLQSPDQVRSISYLPEALTPNTGKCPSHQLVASSKVSPKSPQLQALCNRKSASKAQIASNEGQNDVLTRDEVTPRLFVVFILVQVGGKLQRSDKDKSYKNSLIKIIPPSSPDSGYSTSLSESFSIASFS